jgi:predicted nucleic acid-binding protein
MTGKRFLDTNVLVYAMVLRRGAAVDQRTEAAEGILREGGVVSVQVLSEFCDVLSRKFSVSWPAIGERLDVIAICCGTPIALTAATHKAALGIAKRHKFRIYDALILAAAAEGGCTTVYTEDLRHGQVIEGVRIENPFL